jgi:hypothetical protein
MINQIASTSMFASKAGGMLWGGSESPARAACHSHSIVLSDGSALIVHGKFFPRTTKNRPANPLELRS